MAKDPYVNYLHKYALILIAVTVLDLLILIFRLKAGTTFTVWPYVVIVDFVLFFLIWLSTYDLFWRLCTAFLGGATAMEYFARASSVDDMKGAYFLAGLALFIVLFGIYCAIRIGYAHYIRTYYSGEKGQKFISRLIIASVVLFIATNIFSQ